MINAPAMVRGSWSQLPRSRFLCRPHSPILRYSGSAARRTSHQKANTSPASSKKCQAALVKVCGLKGLCGEPVILRHSWEKRDESCSPYSRLIWVTFSSTVVSSFTAGGVSVGVLSGGGVAAALRSWSMSS